MCTTRIQFSTSVSRLLPGCMHDYPAPFLLSGSSSPLLQDPEAPSSSRGPIQQVTQLTDKWFLGQVPKSTAGGKQAPTTGHYAARLCVPTTIPVLLLREVSTANSTWKQLRGESVQRLSYSSMDDQPAVSQSAAFGQGPVEPLQIKGFCQWPAAPAGSRQSPTAFSGQRRP